MLHVIRVDPGAAMRILSESYRATLDSGIDEIGDVVGMLQAVARPGSHGLEVVTNLFDVGLLSFLKNCIGSPTFSAMQPKEDKGNVR